MNYQFINNYSAYVLSKLIIKHLGMRDAKAANSIKNYILNNEDYSQILDSIDESFNKIYNYCLSNNNIFVKENTFVEGLKTTRVCTMVEFESKNGNNLVFELTNNKKSKLAFFHNNLNNLNKLAELEKNEKVQKFIMLEKYKNDLKESDSNLVSKFFNSKKTGKELAMLEIDRNVFDYTTAKHKKDFYNSLLKAQREISDKNLLNNTFENKEKELNAIIKENANNEAVVIRLNNIIEAYKTFYNNVDLLEKQVNSTVIECFDNSQLNNER